MLNNFIYAKKKSLFLNELEAGNVLDEAIVFIEDTKEIWNHGTYFDGNAVDLSDIEKSIQDITTNYVTNQTFSQTINSVNSGLSSNLNGLSNRVGENTGKISSHDARIYTLESTVDAHGSLFNSKADKTEIPTKVSQLENDANYALKSDLEVEVEVPNGVYIVDLEGNLLDSNSFTGTADDVTGIGLVTDKVKMIVALDEWYSSSSSTAWNGNKRSAWGGHNKTVTGCFLNSNQSQALLDFDGEANTDAIISQLKDTTDSYSQYYTGAPAAEYCRAYSKGYKDAGSWYLPAAGELNEITLNKDAINAILTKLGKNNLSKGNYTWSSSQHSAGYVWSYRWDNSRWYNYPKYNHSGVYPICKLEIKKPLKEKVSELESNKQDILISGTNIKTINGGSILGSGDINVQSDWNETNTASYAYIKNKPDINLVSGCIEIGKNGQSPHMYAPLIWTSNADCYWQFDNKIIICDDFSSSPFVITARGDGTKFLANDGSYKTIGTSGGSGAYAEVNHGTGDTTFALTPNTFHMWDEVTALDLSFADETSGVANEYLFQFTSGATATTLTLPDVKWANDSAPTIAENKIYQISILKGLGSVLEFSNAAALIENHGTYTAGTMTSGATLTFEYPVASDLTINLPYGNTTVIPKGQSSITIDWIEPAAPTIKSIIPSQDNTYIYII